eukprot:6474255-Amphidinium_carterae.1
MATAFSNQMLEPEPETESLASSLEPLLPLRHSAAASVARGVATVCASPPTEGVTIATQTVPVPDSVESSLLSGLPAGPVYIVWTIGETSTLRPGVHSGPHSWDCILRHIPGGVYRSGTDRLRRLPPVAAESDSERLQRAVALFLSEAQKHHVSTRCVVHFWK